MNKKTVLVVDDEAEILEALVFSLKKYFRVLKASNGKEAWDLLRVWKVDCLVTDIDIPGINGAKLIEMIKASTYSSQAIVMTGSYSEETIMSFKALGVSNFFFKPFSARDIRERIETLIGE
ncbi:MAG: response regulator [bacterium]|nr:response regulator [bacterium]